MSKGKATLTNSIDTFIDEDAPNRNHHRWKRLAVGTRQSALLYFANPAPTGAIITSAKLVVRTANDHTGGEHDVTAQRVIEKYAIGTVTFNNAPAVGGPTVTATIGAGDGTRGELDLSTILQPVADGAGWFGLMLTGANSTTRWLRSGNVPGTWKPFLEVEWTEVPATPTTGTPSGGQAVNAAAPALSLEYGDLSGSTALAAMRVQVDAAQDEATPDFDSGEVPAAGTVASLDLSTTAFAPLAEAATSAWRGMVKDSAGRWSAWSEWFTWTRTAKGVVTIDSPAGGTLTDFTPTVLYSFSKTASKRRSIVTRLDTETVVYDSGETPDVSGAFVIEGSDGRAVLTLGPTYRLDVLVWDDEDRIGTGGDPAYSIASTEFTLTTGAPAAVTNVTATPLVPLPKVRLSFDRAAAPDSFAILHDGAPVRVNLDPAVLFDAGTTYTVDLPVRPNVPQQWAVHAVENGVMSPAATVDATFEVGGIWLLDEDNDLALMVADTAASELELTEDAATLFPLGASRPVRITEGLHGYSGKVTGVLLASETETLHEVVDTALTMRSRPGRNYRLVVGSEVFECVIGNLTVRPTGDSKPALRPVSFEVWQDDEQRVPVGP